MAFAYFCHSQGCWNAADPSIRGETLGMSRAHLLEASWDAAGIYLSHPLTQIPAGSGTQGSPARCLVHRAHQQPRVHPSSCPAHAQPRTPAPVCKCPLPGAHLALVTYHCPHGGSKGGQHVSCGCRHWLWVCRGCISSEGNKSGTSRPQAVRALEMAGHKGRRVISEDGWHVGRHSPWFMQVSRHKTPQDTLVTNEAVDRD
jgi:hypothetical protein